MSDGALAPRVRGVLATLVLSGCGLAYSDAPNLVRDGGAATAGDGGMDVADVSTEPSDTWEQPWEEEPVQEPPVELPVPPVSAADAAVEVPADLRLARSAVFDGYLTDGLGQPLYMFIGDTPGKPETACLGDCARAWRAFDVEAIRVGSGIDPSEVTRFHRQDGAWQTAFKGHPLYYRVSEAGRREITVDGLDGRWFVARDYLAFFISPRNFLPAEDLGTGARVLTDGYGRTLYVCLDDAPASTMAPPVSVCTGECLAMRPPLLSMVTARTMALPSIVPASEIGSFTRPDGLAQLTYRGWPLYYFRGDLQDGATDGHNQNAWRAIDPVAFGNQAALVAP